jgi:hypothetical protein
MRVEVSTRVIVNKKQYYQLYGEVWFRSSACGVQLCLLLNWIILSKNIIYFMLVLIIHYTLRSTKFHLFYRSVLLKILSYEISYYSRQYVQLAITAGNTYKLSVTLWTSTYRHETMFQTKFSRFYYRKVPECPYGQPQGSNKNLYERRQPHHAEITAV